MKNVLFNFITLVLFTLVAAGEVKITALKGEAFVRHGASEAWVQAAVGDVLKPNDSMKSGKQSSVTVIMESGKKIVVPEQVIVDISDLRELTQEEFLLKLAMEQVRSVPIPEKDKKLNIPMTTITHGSQKGISDGVTKSSEAGILQLNGTRVLFDNGYNATGVLKTKQVYRLYPALSGQIENRMMVASAFEKLHLMRDALSEYRLLLNENLSPQQKASIQGKIEELKKKLEG